MNQHAIALNQKTSSGQELMLDILSLKKAALILRALNHKLRQQIISLIDQNDKITVTEIYTHLRIEQSVASQHLSTLRKAGIVTTKRNGKFIYYSLNIDRIQQINECAEKLLK